MAWTTPATAVSNTILTAAVWNASVRDNLLASPNGIATTSGSHFAVTGTNTIAERRCQTATVSTSQDTGGSTGSYVDLATVGPSITASTGTLALSHAAASMSNDTTNIETYFCVDVTGATTIPAADARAAVMNNNALQDMRFTVTNLHALTAGSNTFKIKYKVNSNNGVYKNRNLVVMPL